MNNLIKNELIKIFHKKTLYILLLVMIILVTIISFFNKSLEEGNSNKYYDYDNSLSSESIDLIQDDIDTLDKNDPDNKEQLTYYYSELEAINLLKEYDSNSWQAYIINNYARDIIYQKNISEGTSEYIENKDKYDKFIERLKNDDWKSFVNQELDEINKQIDELKSTNEYDKDTLESLEDNKQVLTWRIEKNIEYGNNNLNDALESWKMQKSQLRDLESKEKTNTLEYSDKYQKQILIQSSELYKYQIENEIKDAKVTSDDGNNYYLSKTIDSDLATSLSLSQYGLFIIIVIIVISGTIVSEEFNKGTIKLLLVRPYKRIKILLSKFITCLIILLFMYLLVFIIQFILGGITYGFSNYSFNIITYDFNTNSIQNINAIKYMLLIGAGISPLYILLMTLSFTLSTLFTNSQLAIALPLLGYMFSNIINQIAYNYDQAEFLKFFVTPNWNLNIFLFGRISQFEPISFSFSLTVCIVYFLIMIILSSIIFNKKEIKNI